MVNKQKSWAETVKPWESYPKAGLRRVETKSPDMTGIQFHKDHTRTDDEKKLMMEYGLKFFNEPQAWLKLANPEARDETISLARRIAEQRMSDEGKAR